MIYFLIEINGLKQLKQVEQKGMQSVLESLYGILGIKEYNVLIQNNDFIFLSLLYKEIHKDRIIDSFFNCFDFLIRQKKILQAFNIVVEYDETQPEDLVYNRLISALFGSSVINSLYITESAQTMFADYFVCEQEGLLYRVKERKDYIDPLFSRGGSLHHREEVKQRIIETIVDFNTAESKRKIIHLHSSPNSYVRKNLKRALAEIAGQEEVDWCWFESIHGESEYRPPFAEDFLACDPLAYREFLDNTQLEILSRADSEFESIEDRLHEDLFIRIGLCLQSYISYCRSKYLPPVIVFENSDNLCEKNAAWLSDLLDNIQGGIPVLLSNSGKAHEAFDCYEVLDIRIDDMSEEEIDSKLPGIEENRKEKRKIIKICENNPDYLFYYSFLKARGDSLNSVSSKADIHNLLIKSFDIQVRKIFYIISVSRSFLEAQDITSFCGQLGLENEVIDSALDELSSLNLVDMSHSRLIVGKDGTFGSLLSLLKKETASIDSALVDFLVKEKSRKLLFRHGLIDFLCTQLENEAALDLLLDALLFCLDRQEIDYTQTILASCMKAYTRKQKDNAVLGNLISFIRLRIALLTGDEISASNIIPSLPASSDTETSLENLILQGKYHNSVKNYRSAMTCLKNILVRFEEHEEPFAIGKAYLELGLSFLGLRKLEEAREYFSIAQEHAGRFKLTYQYIRALVMHAASLQFIGNYSEAVRLLEEAETLCDTVSCRSWQTLAMFLLGRTKFELGEYEESINLYQKTMTLSLLYRIPEVVPVCCRWMARSFAFFGKYGLSETLLKEMDSSPERDFFLAENYYFQHRIGDAKEVLDGNGRNLRSETFRPSEYIVYKTGYSMVEDFALASADGECVLSYLERAFKSYINGLSGASTEASADLFSITREDKLSDIDPNIHLYYLFATMVSGDVEESPALDKITLLSKGLKILQERASEIDSPNERRSYLTLNRWNSILLEEARKYKLT